MLPRSDWRLYCHGHDDECLDDYKAGAMTHPNAMSGTFRVLAVNANDRSHLTRSRQLWSKWSSSGRL